MLNKFLLLLLIIPIFKCSITAQNKYNLSQFGSESLQFIKQPTKWESNDWLKLGLISAGTILIMQTDLTVREEFLKDKTYNESFPIEAGRIWGEVYTTVFITGSFGLHGLITNDLSTKKIGFEIVQSAIYAGVITQFLKVAVGRARPLTNRGSATYHQFTLLDDDFHSLPSGHTTLAFSLSTVLSKNSKTDFLKIISYLPAVLTAVSRIYQDKHWVSDVFLGGIIGYFAAEFITDVHEKNNGAKIVPGQQISIIIPLN